MAIIEQNQLHKDHTHTPNVISGNGAKPLTQRLYTRAHTLLTSSMAIIKQNHYTHMYTHSCSNSNTKSQQV
jgi:hypothetical protein